MDWYPRYPVAYMTDTLCLSLAAHGAYCLLIDRYMLTEKPIPNDDKSVARILGCSVDDWLVVADEVMPYFVVKNGLITHKRCDQELDKQGKRKKRRTAAAHAGAQARHEKKPGAPKKQSERNDSKNNDLHAYRKATAKQCSANALPIAQQRYATGQDRTEEVPLVPHNTVGASSVSTESDSTVCAREKNTEPDGGLSLPAGGPSSPPLATGPSLSVGSEPVGDGVPEGAVRAAIEARAESENPWTNNQLSPDKQAELKAIAIALKNPLTGAQVEAAE